MMQRKATTPPIAIPYARQSIEEEEIAAVCRALRENFITRGPAVSRFEAALAKRCGAPHAIAFASGSAALNAAAQALQLGPGDEVYVPGNTFIASATCAATLGCKLHFVDIDPATGLMDIEDFLRRFSPNPRGKSALIAVHFAGRGLDLARLRQRLDGHQLLIIEDAAHAIGGRFADDRPVGSCSHSDLCAFSFHATKNMTTGEGGAVTTRSEALAHALKRARDSGVERDPKRQIGPCQGPWYYEVLEAGTNRHLTDFQAALGLVQLGKLERFRRSKNRALERYAKRLSILPQVTLTPHERDSKWHFHLCFIQIDFKRLGRSRSDLMRYLRSRGIGTQVHYIPLYRHPCWGRESMTSTCHSLDPLPGCELHYEKTLSLPLFAGLSLPQVDLVCSELGEWLKKPGK